MALTDRADRAERRARTLRLAAEVAQVVRRAFEDAGVSDATIARALGCGETRVGAWWRGGAHVPLFVLLHPGLPAAPRVAALRAVLERVQASMGRVPLTPATCALMRAAGELIAAGAEMLLDGAVDAREAERLRPLVARLNVHCLRWLHDHGGQEVAPC